MVKWGKRKAEELHMGAISRKITLSAGRRIICISDIHGHLDLFQKLLQKIGYRPDDQLILLGDLYAKGPKRHETLQFIIRMAENPNVHVLRGNCDWGEDFLTPEEAAWQDDLPHILETEDYIFVHGGLPSMEYDAFEPVNCMKFDNFMERAGRFEKWVITGHWPVNNYCHEIPCFNPIVNAEKHIIAIDGGCVVVHHAGQLNALLIENGQFSAASADMLPQIRVERAQPASGGTLYITYTDRFVEVLEHGEPLSLCRHLASGKMLEIPNEFLWRDWNGRLGAGVAATDYSLPVEAGETVSLVREYPDRLLVKRDGVLGWLAR